MNASSQLTLIDLLRRHARELPDKRALTFLRDGEEEAGVLTYAELERQARALAAWLEAEGLEGERVLLLFPSGLEFVVAFIGCLYAGAVAVPIYPPKLNRNTLRLRSVVKDAQPALALTTAPVLQRIQPLLAEAGLEKLRIEAVDDLPTAPPENWQGRPIDENTLAFLQYTSGSTSNPKGVMITHGNLVANHRMIQCASRLTPESRILTWLPLFHDMGLILKLLQTLFLGAEFIFMPPESFLLKPVRWLAGISKYRATFSGGPNFAYDLCVKKIPAEQRQALDLSSWDAAIIAAEPVRAGTLDRFAEAFAPSGFRRRVLMPGYGLAEATVMVTVQDMEAPFPTVTVDNRALETERCVVPLDGSSSVSRVFVGNGLGRLEQDVAIVDPATCAWCAADGVGEIWVRGPHVARGYWNRPEETRRTFGARIAGEEDHDWLRTGDLGFILGDELHISGRIKDLIIVAGRNHDPADIELTLGASHPAIRAEACAAFQVEVEDSAKLVVAVELERTCGVATARREGPGIDPREVVQAVRQAVAENHDLATHAVVLLRPATLPKTSSGKVQRHACHAAWVAGTFTLWDSEL